MCLGNVLGEDPTEQGQDIPTAKEGMEKHKRGKAQKYHHLWAFLSCTQRLHESK